MTGPSTVLFCVVSTLTVRMTLPVIVLYVATFLNMPMKIVLMLGLPSMTLKLPVTILVSVFLLTLRKPVGWTFLILLLVQVMMLRASTIRFVLPFMTLIRFLSPMQPRLNLVV